MARAKKQKLEHAEEIPTAVQEMIDAEENIISEESFIALEDADEQAIAEEGETAVALDAASEDVVVPEDLALTQEDVRLVEAILFASSTALTVGMIAERFPKERVSLIPDVLEYLKEQYATRGVNLVQRENRWALRTATDLGANLRLEKEQPKKFTKAAMETMAIVAYHQPVTRAEIENIRGVATSPGALDALMEAGWIKPGKRREVPGRPVTWLSTQSFLDHFGLEKIEDLPGMEELKAAGLLDKRPAVEAMPTADMFDGNDRNMEDPQEVTDEDLVGKVTEEGGSAAELDQEETTAQAPRKPGMPDEDEVDEDEPFELEDREEVDEEDEDDEDADDEDDEDSDDEDDEDDLDEDDEDMDLDDEDLDDEEDEDEE